MPREPIAIRVKMDQDIFRRFALFDTFSLKKRWRPPALFSLILLLFAAICFASGRNQSAFIGCVLTTVGLGLPAVYVGMFFSQLKAQIQKLRLDRPRPVYTLTLACDGLTVQNDMKAEETLLLKWTDLHAAWRVQGCVYLYATPSRAFLLPDGQANASPDDLWDYLAAHMPSERIHQK